MQVSAHPASHYLFERVRFAGHHGIYDTCQIIQTYFGFDEVPVIPIKQSK